MRTWIAIVTAVLIGTAAFSLSGCMGNGSISEAAEGNLQHEGTQPYAVRTELREYTTADPSGSVIVYGRYTELTVEEDAPDTLKAEAAACNQRAEESVTSRANDLIRDAQNGDPADTVYVTLAYIVTVMRADETAFSFLETELTSVPSENRGALNPYQYSYHFSGHTFDTETGEEILLSDVMGDGKEREQIIADALYARYGISGLTRTDASGYAWTADALGIRFLFHSDAVSEEKRREAGDYTGNAVTASVPYSALTSEKAVFLSHVPEAYIAQMEPETVYDLPHGDMSVMITEQDGETVFRRIPDSGQTEDLIIEYADRNSAYYIIRSLGGFYLFRERVGYQEGFIYDFARPDGGYGRFANHITQYIDSYQREIGLAFAYDPHCVHMCERRRSFGKESYDSASFVPNGYYSFPDAPDSRYKTFVLTEETLSIDTYGTACRLLEDFTAMKLDEEGIEAGGITVKAGSAMILEKVRGEGSLYLPPTQRNRGGEYVYDCRLMDGTGVRFVSAFESTLLTDGSYMNRVTEPVSLWDAQFVAVPEEKEVFTVRIGGREYPVIPDYSKKDHTGEEIDFGDELWWQAEGYTGRYTMTEDDREAMRDEYFTEDALSHAEGGVTLAISEDGHAELDYFGTAYEGDLPDKRFYHEYVEISMESPYESRTFVISLREGEYHSVPEKIELYSEGLPATNEPSKVPPLVLYLTKDQAD